MILKVFSFFFSVLFFFTSCGEQGNLSLNEQSGGANTSSNCNCSQTVTTGSVCGSNGVTYLNACEARCRGVLQYSPGGCGLQNCNSNSGSVCGQPPYNCPQGQFCATVMPSPKTYANDCERVGQQATFLYTGDCR